MTDKTPKFGENYKKPMKVRLEDGRVLTLPDEIAAKIQDGTLNGASIDYSGTPTSTKILPGTVFWMVIVVIFLAAPAIWLFRWALGLL